MQRFLPYFFFDSSQLKSKKRTVPGYQRSFSSIYPDKIKENHFIYISKHFGPSKALFLALPIPAQLKNISQFFSVTVVVLVCVYAFCNEFVHFSNLFHFQTFNNHINTNINNYKLGFFGVCIFNNNSQCPTDRRTDEKGPDKRSDKSVTCFRCYHFEFLVAYLVSGGRRGRWGFV